MSFRVHSLRRSILSESLSRHQLIRPQSRRQIVTEAITISHDALQSLHTITGLPWALSIPVFAALVRTTFILPITIYQRKANLRQIQLQPVLYAWAHVLRKDVMAKYGHLGPKVTEAQLISAVNKKRRELYKRWNCGLWKTWLGLLQFPVFLSVMEALRKMAGSKEGILGMLPGIKNLVAVGDTNVDGVLTGDGLVAEALQIPMETSLATEGMLWFPDLLVADPHLVLPFVLSGTIMLSLFGGLRKSGNAPLSKWQNRLRRGMGFGALLIGPIMLHVPSALLLYWISSSSMAFIQAMILEKVMPNKPPPNPCKNPTAWRAGIGRPSEQSKAT